jgi:hypothetical protein
LTIASTIAFLLIRRLRLPIRLLLVTLIVSAFIRLRFIRIGASAIATTAVNATGSRMATVNRRTRGTTTVRILFVPVLDLLLVLILTKLRPSVPGLLIGRLHGSIDRLLVVSALVGNWIVVIVVVKLLESVHHRCKACKML